MTPIKSINSAAIRAALSATSDTYATKIGMYDHPQHAGDADWRITLWLLPCGEFVIETNGDAIFETNGDSFVDSCAEYGIEEVCE